MTESLLLGLIELFAITTKFQQDRERVDSVVRFFLRSQLDVVKVEKYLTLFDSQYRNAIKNCKRGDDFWASEAGRLLSVGALLNKELTQEQKINILYAMFSAVETDRSVTEIELNFLKTLSDVFYLDEDVFFTALSFSILELESDPSERGCVVAFAGGNADFSRESILVIPSLDGVIGVLEMDKQGLYYVKYMGDHRLSMNDVRMMENVVYNFNYGDIIRIHGNEPLHFTDVYTKLANDQGKLVFDVNKISYVFPNGKTGIHEMSFNETSGRLVGIMGSSGAGKSTLVEVLNGNRKPATGQVSINGINIHEERDRVEGVIGYVPQDDLLIEDLTTFQNLYFAAKLSFKDMSDDEASELARKVIKDLGLTEAMDLKVGNPLEKSLSGGQRKRLNIGLELLRAPSVLFLDEPTSGLSTSDSENIMDLLKELAESGKLVYVVIHQPSSDIFKLFDRLLIMDTGGYFIYYGNPLDAITYFKNKTNSLNKDIVYDHGYLDPDIIFEIIESKTLTNKGAYTSKRKVAPLDWYQEFRKKFMPMKKEYSGGILHSIEPASWWEQLRVFFLRDMLAKLSNMQYLFINTVQAPLLALLLATLTRYYDIEAGSYVFSDNINMPIFLFMSVIVSLFLGLTVSAEEIVHDRKILKRERFLNLSRSSYLVSKLGILFFTSAVQMLMYWYVSYHILGFSSFSFTHYFTLLSTAAFANMLGLNISSMFNRAITVYILIPIILIPQLILSGVVLPFDRINPDVKARTVIPLVSETMASRWAYEGLMVSFFKDNEYNKHLYPLHQKRIQNEVEFLYKLPILDSKLNYAVLNHNSQKPAVKEQIRQDLQVVRNELRGYPRVDALVEGCSEWLLDDALSYIEKERQRRMMLSSGFVDEESAKHRELDKLYRGPGRLNIIRETSHNESIEDRVRNLDEEKRITEIDGHLKVLSESVYMEPGGNKILARSRLYMAHKYLLGIRLSTPVFNIIVLWLMSAFLYGMLYYNVLRWTVKLFEKLKKKRK